MAGNAASALATASPRYRRRGLGRAAGVPLPAMAALMSSTATAQDAAGVNKNLIIDEILCKAEGPPPVRAAPDTRRDQLARGGPRQRGVGIAVVAPARGASCRRSGRARSSAGITHE